MKTATENLLGVVKDKAILFLENDEDLSIDLEHVETFLKENKVDYKTLNGLPKLDFEVIAEAIKAADVIIFQSTWTTVIVSKLKDFITGLKDTKQVIEVYMDNPHWYYKPDTLHDVYILRTHSYLWDPMYEDDPLGYWQFHKLHSKIPIWKFKNKFDK